MVGLRMRPEFSLQNQMHGEENLVAQTTEKYWHSERNRSEWGDWRWQLRNRIQTITELRPLKVREVVRRSLSGSVSYPLGEVCGCQISIWRTLGRERRTRGG